MKVWKRCLAALLSFMVFTTSVNISEAAGIYDPKNYIWTATDAEIVAEHYGLESRETDVLYSKAVNRGYSYILYAPYNNGTKGKKDLIGVDYVNKIVYAKALHTAGCSWLPVSAVLSAEGVEKEVITLATGTCYYDDVEYNASQAFTYDGNSYSVSVKYQLHVNISADEQTRILQIPIILAQTAKNLEKDFVNMRTDLKNLGNMIPAMSKLLAMEFEKEETTVNTMSNDSDFEVVFSTPEVEQSVEVQSREVQIVQAQPVEAVITESEEQIAEENVETEVVSEAIAETETVSELKTETKKVPAFD